MSRGALGTALLSLFGLLGVAAQSWSAEPPIDAHSLGITESMRHYCAGVDPASAVRFEARVKTLVQDASKKELAAARAGQDYRAAYDSVTDFVAKIDQHNAKKFCNRPLPEHLSAAADQDH